MGDEWHVLDAPVLHALLCLLLLSLVGCCTPVGIHHVAVLGGSGGRVRWEGHTQAVSAQLWEGNASRGC